MPVSEPAAVLEFCGERYPLPAGQVVTIGRDADVIIDDNPYLHRVFLTLSESEGLVWLTNVGTRLSATVADSTGLAQTWLASGARVPLVVSQTNVVFSAGPTTYDFIVYLAEPPYNSVLPRAAESISSTTVGRVNLTPSQRLLIVSLAEPLLTNGLGGKGNVPSSREAAERLGWTMSAFNRKLDTVCEKLSREGVKGLVGVAGATATHRKIRLVEYAVASRLVVAEDLSTVPSR